jgi:hypothetical protein
MTGRSPLITLNNGVTMPALGLGVLNRSAPERTADAVACAIAKGYRLIDTAASYANEQLVGDAWLVGRVTGQEYAKRDAYPEHTDQRYPREPWFVRRDAAAYGVVLDAHGWRAPADVEPGSVVGRVWGGQRTVAAIAAIDTSRRGGSDPEVVDAITFSITIEDEASTGDPLITA